MVVFNPAVSPTQDPDYRRYTDDVKVPRSIQPSGQEANTIRPHGNLVPDESGKYLGESAAYSIKANAAGLEGLGTIIKGTSSVLDQLGSNLDTILKDKIREGLYKDVDPVRSTYTQQLLTYTQPGQTVPAGPVLGGKPGVGDGSSEDMPMPLTQLPQRLAQVAGIPTSGAMSEDLKKSYYEAQLDKIAKDYRTRYPGQRPFIDSELSRITGGNPANQRINSLYTELQTNLGRVNEESKNLRELAEQAGNAGMREAPVYYQQVLDNKMSPMDFRQKIADYHAFDADQKRAIAQNNLNLIQGTLDSEKVNVQINTKLPALASNIFDKLIDSTTGQKIYERIQDSQNNPPNPIEGRNLVVALQLGKTEYLQRAGKMANDLSWYKIPGMDAKKTDEMIMRHASLFDQLIGVVGTGKAEDYAIANHYVQNIKAITTIDTHALLTDQSAGPPTRAIKALRDQVGDDYMGQVMKNSAVNGVYDTLAAWSVNTKLNFATGQPNGKNETAPSLSSAIDTLRKFGFNDSPKTVDDLINNVGMVTRPGVPDEAKRQLFKSYFGPDNMSLLNKRLRDTNNIDKMPDIFRRLTRSEIVDEAYKQGKDSDSWKYVKDWTIHSFGSFVARKNIADLADIQSDPNFKVAWNDSVHRLDILYKGVSVNNPNNPALANTGEYANIPKVHGVANSLNELNKNMSSLVNVIKKDGGDVGAAVINVLMKSNSGINPEQWSGTNRAILEAIKISKLDSAKIEAADKLSKLPDESARNQTIADDFYNVFKGMQDSFKNTTEYNKAGQTLFGERFKGGVR